MITSLEQETKEKRSNFLEEDLKKYFVDKNKIKDYPEKIWFKGSRFR